MSGTWLSRRSHRSMDDRAVAGACAALTNLPSRSKDNFSKSPQNQKSSKVEPRSTPPWSTPPCSTMRLSPNPHVPRYRHRQSTTRPITRSRPRTRVRPPSNTITSWHRVRTCCPSRAQSSPRRSQTSSCDNSSSARRRRGRARGPSGACLSHLWRLPNASGANCRRAARDGQPNLQHGAANNRQAVVVARSLGNGWDHCTSCSRRAARGAPLREKVRRGVNSDRSAASRTLSLSLCVSPP